MHNINYCTAPRPEKIPLLPVAAGEEVGTGAEKFYFYFMTCRAILHKQLIKTK